MNELAKLVVKLEAQSAQYVQQLEFANKKLSQFERNQSMILGKINKGFGVVKGALALAGITLSIGAIVKATADAEDAFALLQNAVDASGGAAGRTAVQLAETASALQKVTSYDDEAIAGMEQLLLRFQSIQGTNFDRATTATLDLAAALHMDLAGAAQLVGKALEMPEKGMTALAKKGIVLDDQQQKLIKSFMAAGRQADAQAVLLGALEKKYDGAALAVRNTFGGALSGLKNSFGDLLEGKGGVSDATKAINDFTDILNSEGTKKGFATFIGGLFQIVSWTAKAVTAVSDFATWMGEEFAASVHGPAADDLVRQSEAIIALRDSIKAFENEGAVKKWLENKLANPEDAGLPKDTTDIHAATLETMRKRLAALEAQYDKARTAASAFAAASAAGAGGAAPGAPKPNGPTATLPPSEEFTKMEAKLKEQIALFGKTGEAAKLAYQIENDQIEGLSKKEEKRLMQLAQTLDAMGKKSEADKEAEAAQKALAQNYDKEVEGLTRTLALTGEVTELERIRYETANGSLKGITDQQKQALEVLAKQADLAKQTQAYDNQVKSLEQQLQLTGEVTELERIRYEMLRGNLQSVNTDQKTNLENLARQVDLMKERAKVEGELKAAVEETATPLEKYQNTIAKLNELYAKSHELLGASGMSYEVYTRAVTKAQEELDKALLDVDSFFNDIRKAADQSLGDGIYKAIHEGFSKGAKSALDSFGNMLEEMAIKSTQAQLSKLLFGAPSEAAGGGGGGGFGGWIGKGLGAISNIFGGMRDSGGRGHPGQVYAIGKGAQPELFVPDTAGEFYPAGQAPGRGSRGGSSTTNIFVQGTVNERTVRQIDVQQARRQRVAMRTS